MQTVDLTHVIMEQAMRYGRTVTFSKSDASAHQESGAAAQYVSIKLAAADGTSRLTMVPTHAVDGRQLQDKDWIHFVREMAGELDAMGK